MSNHRAKKYIVTLIAIIANYCSIAQSLTDSLLGIYEDSLCRYFDMQNSKYTFDDKRQLNDSIEPLLQTILSDANSYGYPFERLSRKISITSAPDGKFRIFDWDIASPNGTHTYFALMQIRTKTDISILQLIDKSDSIADAERRSLDKDNWFGALYYNIVLTKIGKKCYYTLLGWDGNDLFTDRKVIDIISFDNDEPTFGLPMFYANPKDPKEVKHRVLFEYSYKCSITLTYNPKLNMIVFDHLSPVANRYEGMREYYGADFSYDGFSFENGKWQIKEDLDARNPKPLKKKQVQ